MDFSQKEFDEILNVFSLEAEEIISRLNNNLIALEKAEDKSDIILSLFRDAHSLKGAARMVGFNNAQEIAHKIEDVLGDAKENKLEFNEIVANKLYAAIDFLSELIQTSIINKKENFTEGISFQLNTLDEIFTQPPPKKSKDTMVSSFLDTLNLDFVQKEITTKFESFSYLDEISHFLNTFNETKIDALTSNILKRLSKIVSFAKDNFIQLDEETISTIRQSMQNLSENPDEVFIDKELILQRLEIIEQLLEINFAPQSKQQKVFDTGEIKTLRVDTKKLDEFANTINELLINKQKAIKHQSKLFEINSKLIDLQKQSPEIADLGVELSKLRSDIDEDVIKNNSLIKDIEFMVKNIRVLPLATIFHLFGRMVRDIAQEKGKQIDLEIIGSNTSVDKNIIEDIKTPLIHIIRNAIDHGIESPERRIELGKNPVGKITLKAKHLNNKVSIEIIDDGSGLNIAKIKERALSKGYLSKAELDNMSDKQIIDIIFWAGFSTGDEITNISGRGIGLDIVQTKIAQLKGTISVDFEVNKGCKVKIELPVNMATMKAIIVKSSGQHFAIPVSMIREIKWKPPFNVDNKTVDIYNLSEIMGLQKTRNDSSTVIVLEYSDKMLGITFDELLDEAEILQKKLRPPLNRVKNLSGVTTILSGEVCFILDVTQILKSVLDSKKTALRQNSDYTILVVDDSATTRIALQKTLQDANFKVLLANDPAEGFKILRTQNVDLILSDLEMPNMNGMAFLEKLKSDELYHNIPFVMLTSIAEAKTKAMKKGAVDYLVKTEFNQEILPNLISNIFAKNCY